MNKARKTEHKQKDMSRTRTSVPGQNPRQNDAPDHDLYNDENRVNPLAPRRGAK